MCSGLGDLCARLRHLRRGLVHARIRLGDGGLRLEHLRLGLIQIGLVALERDLVVTGIELHQQIVLFDVLVVVHPHLHHQPRHARADLVDVPGGIGVVGALMGLLVMVQRQPRDDEHGQNDQRDDDAHERREKPFDLAGFLFVVALAVFAFLAFVAARPGALTFCGNRFQRIADQFSRDLPALYCGQLRAKAGNEQPVYVRSHAV